MLLRPKLPVYRGEKPIKRELSRRELEAVKGLCRGLTNKEIAADMGLGEESVKNALRVAYLKMGVTTRTAALMHALKTGMVSIGG